MPFLPRWMKEMRSFVEDRDETKNGETHCDEKAKIKKNNRYFCEIVLTIQQAFTKDHFLCKSIKANFTPVQPLKRLACPL